MNANSPRATALPPILALAIFGASLAGPNAAAQDNATRPPDIVVTGNREAEAEKVGDLARAITMRPPAGHPLPKQYDPLCVRVFGLPVEVGAAIAKQIEDNARTLNLIVAQPQCAPNSWVGFVRDSQAAVAYLRAQKSDMFADLHGYEIDRILAGSKGAQAWHAVEPKGVDGRPFQDRTIEIEGVQKQVRVNDQWQAGRIATTFRADMVGSIVLFDKGLAKGRTVQQLADYASFRILAPVKDIDDTAADRPRSILTLFANGADTPTGLTPFDWNYLKSFYKLGFGAGAESLQNATRRAHLDGVGEKLSNE